MVKREYLEEALREVSDEHIAEAAVESATKVRNDETVLGVQDVLRSGCGNVESGKKENRTIQHEVEKEEVTGRRTSDRRTSGRTRSGKKKFSWKPVIALVTAAAVLLVVVFGGGQWWNAGESNMSDSVLKAYAVGEAEYPEMSPYPDESQYIKKNGEFDSDSFEKVYDAWWEDQKARRNQPEGYTDGADQFAAVTIPQLLSGAGEENVVYSPLNVYMALAMAAEITDGSGRQQILDLLGADSIETLRWKASAVWNAHYCDDQATASILASSLWLDEGVAFNQETVDRLADTYYASSYQGDLQSEEMSGALKTWLNGQTGGLLEQYVDEISIDPETVLALATTVYFQEKWNDEFLESRTETDIFHSPSGEVECEFMYQAPDQSYYWAEKFGAAFKSLDNGDTMWFILPDEGVTVDDVLADSELTDFLTAERKWENNKRVIIHLYVPKFDVTSNLDLTEGLMELGVTDIFMPGQADFSPLLPEQIGGYFSKVDHAVRVAVDEEGVTAAAYTMMQEAGAAEPPNEEIEFKLDRPFIFAITGRDGLPMFVGVVNQP